MAVELDAIERTYDLIVWTLDRIESFSKTYRIPLGDRMQDTMYSVLDLLVEAKYTRGASKLPLLARANVLLERLRFQGRIACDKGCLSPKQHGHFARLVNDAGTSVGGWTKQQQRAKTTRTAGGAAILLAVLLGALVA